MEHESAPAALIDVALFRLRRVWARPLRPRNVGEPERPVQMSTIMVIGAVHRLSQESSEVTVGAVAEYMDVDPSTASRLVNDAIATGFVAREPSRIDARRVRLVLTDQGRAVREAVTRERRAHIERLVSSWEPAERETFALLLTRFAEASAACPVDPARIDRAIAEAVKAASAP
ncbi:MarR family winged helix-turn-helix transcriptional regulator [Thermostaphylospora chromogena]|uniref:DNA-binding transcriptional regulator, MarR family n=1 Tax=Thermostaphylospora chromogena TaxID=35622 RepID=A0A1H1I5Z2_9ACTN|nr:MarR family winged helix-turn-helix transcriptional regulator [Thermostaphylospora chromogena]SDR33060.1 DNA-binding transcriptional regulator, MarR family [Thermostaphylospora chromogena]